MSNWNESDYYDVSFGIHRSRRYHAKMREFYRWGSDLAVAIGAIASSGVFILLKSAPSMIDVALWISAVAGLAATLNFIFAFAKKAELHNELCMRFTELAARIEGWPATKEFLHRARAERLLIEKDEPTERRLIDLLAQNEEARARGASPEDMVPLSPMQRSLGYIATFGMKRLEKWWAARETAKKQSTTRS